MADFYKKLFKQRGVLGSPMGALECWLLLRSLRTLPLRVKRQSRSARKVALWLSKQPKVSKVMHPIIPSHPSHQLCLRQMKAPPSCFSIDLLSPQAAIALPTKLRLFANATSLGGVESLIEYRYQYDKTLSPCLLRISIGLESAKDLIADLERALSQV